MLSIQPLLKKRIQRAGLKRSLDAYEILKQFQKITKEVFPPEVAQGLEAISFRNGVLKIRCSHPIVAMLFRSQEELLRARLLRGEENLHITRFQLED